MNFDRKNSAEFPRSGRRQYRGIWIILILILVALMAATTVMALDGPESDVVPVSNEDFDSDQALNALRGILAVDAINVPIEYTNQGCLEDYDNKFGSEHQGTLNCTANDSSIGAATVSNSPVCTSYGADVEVTFTITNTSTASSRYDVGYYFSIDGDPDGLGALTGECAAGKLTIPPGDDNDGEQVSSFCTEVDNIPALPEDPNDPDIVACFTDEQCAAQTVQPGKNFCNSTLSAYQDTCGDMNQGVPYATEFTITAKCVDDDENGLLDLPYCTAYDNQQNSDKLCINVLGATPNTKAKCSCNADFNIPVLVPPNVYITKTASAAEVAPGDTFTYNIEYGVDAPSQDLVGVVISDVLHPDLALVSFSANPASNATCGYYDPNNPESELIAQPYPWMPSADQYGWGIICELPDVPAGGSGTVTLEVKVNPDATDRQDIPNTICISGEGAESLPDGTTQEVEACDDETITTPVTVSFFEATSSGGGTSFAWETATETGNAGFNIYVETEDGLQKVNDELILSQVVDSLSPQQYSYAASVAGDTFYISDVSLWNEERMHGPFEVGLKHGQQHEMEKIDWANIHLENNALAAQRSDARRAAVNGQDVGAGLLGRELSLAEASVYPMVELGVSEDRVYRLAYEDLAAAVGNALDGAPMSQLALTNNNVPVPLFVSSDGSFGPGEYIDFYGEGLDTLYTDTNVYVLRVHDGLAVHAAVDNARPDRKAQPAEFYMETLEIENNNQYSYRSSNGDPWFDRALYTVNGLSFNRTVNIDNYVAAAPSTLTVEMWGVSNLVDGDDHHVLVDFNGQQVMEEFFDFSDAVVASAELAASSVKEGANTLTFRVPNDMGGAYDMSALDKYSVRYPRAFVASGGQLAFAAVDDVFNVTGLNSNKVVAYRLSGDELTRLGQVKTRKDGNSFSASFAGNEAEASYFVSTEAALAAPEIALASPLQDISSGSAELLIIAHPNFISGLQPLVDQRRSEGLTVKVVDVQQIFKQYNGSIFDAAAIQEYVRHAISRMGTEYVLLVGGDTRDYRNYKGNDSISFVPTLYGRTSKYILMAPVDPKIADITGNGVPDAAIGRFPVHTVQELNAVVGKTLTYHERDDRNAAVFAADTGFERDSDSLIPAGWDVEKTYISDGLAEARANLLAQMNAGVPVASFIGHSDRSFWSFDNLLTSTDAAALTNYGKPMVVNQWGCFNTYFVGEAYVTLGDNFLLKGNQGAAAVTGATTITEATSEQRLGALMMPKMMTSGVRIGDAMQDAKAELAKTHPKLADVLLGWTILGDPTLVVTQ